MGDSFGWGVTTAYVFSGLSMAVLIGTILSRFDLDDQVADYVFRTPTATLHAGGHRPTLHERVDAALDETRDIFGRVWKWVIVALSLPEFILLRQVLKPRLLGIFFGSTAAAIVLIGLGFNLFA